jgi:hypothetical protein
MAFALLTPAMNWSGYLRPKTYSLVSWQCGAMRMGSFDANTMVVVASYILASFLSNPAMQSASAILGMLISVEWRFGTMFILLALGRRLCFNCIFFYALILVLSGSINTFSDGRPVLWKQSMSCSVSAPNVQPVSSMLNWFLTFHFHFAAILFCNFEG